MSGAFDRSRGLDDDGLQADVMRFMAIIAFCLIAIMALARNGALEAPPTRESDASGVVETPRGEVVLESPAHAATHSADRQPRRESQDPRLEEMDRLPATPRTTPPSVDREPERDPSARRLAAIEEAPQPPIEVSVPANVAEPPVHLEEAFLEIRRSAPPPRRTERSPVLDLPRPDRPRLPDAPTNPAPVVAGLPKEMPVDVPIEMPVETRADFPGEMPEVVPQEVRQEVPEAVSTPRATAAPSPDVARPEEDAGLVLRFASDADFRRLLGAGVVELFAWREPARVLGYTSGGRFEPVPAPGTVHELLASTVPEVIREALARRGDGSEPFQWAVRLPPNVENEIRRHAASGASGVILIDGRAQVRLVSSSGERAGETS